MRTLIAIVLCALLTACAGTPFKWSSARQLEQGMTAEEVTRIMGPPYMVTSAGNRMAYIWSYASASGRTRAMRVEFEDDRVVQVPKVPDSFKD